MGKIFLLIGILFVIALVVTIFAGNITWENIKTAGVAVKESFQTISHNIIETQERMRDAVVGVFKTEKKD